MKETINFLYDQVRSLQKRVKTLEEVEEKLNLEVEHLEKALFNERFK